MKRGPPRGLTKTMSALAPPTFASSQGGGARRSKARTGGAKTFRHGCSSRSASRQRAAARGCLQIFRAVRSWEPRLVAKIAKDKAALELLTRRFPVDVRPENDLHEDRNRVHGGQRHKSTPQDASMLQGTRNR